MNSNIIEKLERAIMLMETGWMDHYPLPCEEKARDLIKEAVSAIPNNGLTEHTDSSGNIWVRKDDIVAPISGELHAEAFSSALIECGGDPGDSDYERGIIEAYLGYAPKREIVEAKPLAEQGCVHCNPIKRNKLLGDPRESVTVEFKP